MFIWGGRAGGGWYGSLAPYFNVTAAETEAVPAAVLVDVM